MYRLRRYTEVPGIPWVNIDDPFNDNPAMLFYEYPWVTKSRDYDTEYCRKRRARLKAEKLEMEKLRPNSDREKIKPETLLPWSTPNV